MILPFGVKLAKIVCSTTLAKALLVSFIPPQQVVFMFTKDIIEKFTIFLIFAYLSL